MSDFFPDNLAVFICSHIFENTKPILLVSHEDDDWQFLCGGEHDENEKPKVVGIGHLLERDPSLLELADLPRDCEAERRTVDEKWSITRCEE